ncbi:MAG: PmoA family protein, partial [bacterium]|nr:PmoA family protein [bacterium]
NNAGSDRLKGNHEPARWVAMSGKLAGDPAYIAALSHAKNFRAPQPARLHPTMPYFCFSPCVTEAFVIDKEHPFVGRYRFVVADGEPDSEALNHVWKAWCDQDE